jgi:hypothetical protein
VKRLVNGREETFLGSGLGVTQRLFDHIGSMGLRSDYIRRKKTQLRSFGLDQLWGLGVSVGRKIIADDDVCGLKRGTKDVAAVFTKDCGGSGPSMTMQAVWCFNML